MKIIAILSSTYPAAYRGMSKEAVDGVVSIWSSMFDEEDVETVAVALKKCIAENRTNNPPSIGAVKHKIWEETGTKYPSAEEAWNGIWKTLQEKNWKYRDAFNALPPLVRYIVANASILKRWSEMDDYPLEHYVLPDFKKDYKEAVRQKQDFEKAPRDVREYYKSIGRVPFDDETAPVALPPPKETVRYEMRDGNLVAVVTRERQQNGR